MTPQVIDDFLPQEIYARVCAWARSRPLEYGAKSNKDTDPHGHLSWKLPHDSRHSLADIEDMLPPVCMEVWERIVARAGGACRLIRCYINAYSYGMDGYFHTDSERDGERTAILYICDQWDRDWAGETVCQQDQHYWAVLPKPNRLLILPSNMPHAARAVSRKCMGLRMVLVFKVRPVRSEKFEELSTWLVQHGARRYEHQRGSLHDHCVRVYQSLEHWGVAQQVALGGGLHSIYGTNVYQQRLIYPGESERAAVARKFGREAEDLAYQFSILDRPRTLEDAAGFLQRAPAGSAPVYGLAYTHSGGNHAGAEVLRALCLIECANLADQDSLGKWPNLKRMWDEHKTTVAT